MDDELGAITTLIVHCGGHHPALREQPFIDELRELLLRHGVTAATANVTLPSEEN